MKNKVSFLTKKPVLSFFALAFLISWILWIPLLYGHFKLGWTSWEGDSWTNYKTWLGNLGALGPAISALIMAGITGGKKAVKILLKRVVQWRINILWWLVAFYGWWIICSLSAAIFNLSPLQSIVKGLLASLINIPAIIVVLQLPLLIGMFGEELGWRGFALPKLLNRYNPIIASLILAVPWIFWHTPLAVFQEWRGNIPIWHFFMHYALIVLPLTLIFTWFFQKTKGSILLAILLHKSLNLTFNAYSIALGLNETSAKLLKNISISSLWVIALLIVINYLFKIKLAKTNL